MNPMNRMNARGAGDKAPQNPHNTGFLTNQAPHAYSHYIVQDTQNMQEQGFLDPTTGRPYPHTYQPSVSHLANAMDQHVRLDSHTCRSWSIRDFGPVGNWVYKEYMQYNYPNRSVNNYNDTNEIRKSLDMYITW